MTTERNEQFMRAALNEARKALGQTSPNPAVGAVLVIDNRIVAKGRHREAWEVAVALFGGYEVFPGDDDGACGGDGKKDVAHDRQAAEE